MENRNLFLQNLLREKQMAAVKGRRKNPPRIKPKPTPTPYKPKPIGPGNSDLIRPNPYKPKPNPYRPKPTPYEPKPMGPGNSDLIRPNPYKPKPINSGFADLTKPFVNNRSKPISKEEIDQTMADKVLETLKKNTEGKVPRPPKKTFTYIKR